MISAFLLKSDGTGYIACGITPRVMEDLREGKMVVFSLSEHGLAPVDVILIPGKNEDDIKDFLESHSQQTVAIDKRQQWTIFVFEGLKTADNGR